MEVNLKESYWTRAQRDTETFRNNSFVWFLGVEVVGSAAIAALTAGLLWDRTTIAGWKVAVITFVTFVAGLLLMYGAILIWSLVRAPYKQRNEARARAMELQTTLAELDIIDGFAQQCSAFLDKNKGNMIISTGFPLPDQDLVDHRILFDNVSNWLKERTYPESELWHRIVDIANRHPDYDDLIHRYELGYEVLRKIKVSIQLASRSQKQ